MGAEFYLEFLSAHVHMGQGFIWSFYLMGETWAGVDWYVASY